MSDRIHLAWCDRCGDEIYEGDVHEVTRERAKPFGGPIGSWSTEPRHVLGPTRYACERCIAGPRVVACRVVRVDDDVAHVDVSVVVPGRAPKIDVVVSVPGWDGSGRTGREGT